MDRCNKQRFKTGFCGYEHAHSANEEKWGTPSRQGAKRIRKREQSLADGLVLTPANAALYRALSARANYLAQDRAD